MRKLLLLGFVVVVALSGCTAIWDFLTGFIPEDYDHLVGSWTVVSKPEGWADYRFHFDDDRTFSIDYENLYWTDQTSDPIIEGYSGTIVSVDDKEFTARKSEALANDESRTTFPYRFVGEEKNTIQIGLYDEDTGNAVYHWEAIRD